MTKHKRDYNFITDVELTFGEEAAESHFQHMLWFWVRVSVEPFECPWSQLKWLPLSVSKITPVNKLIEQGYSTGGKGAKSGLRIKSVWPTNGLILNKTRF